MLTGNPIDVKLMRNSRKSEIKGVIIGGIGWKKLKLHIICHFVEVYF